MCEDVASSWILLDGKKVDCFNFIRPRISSENRKTRRRRLRQRQQLVLASGVAASPFCKFLHRAAPRRLNWKRNADSSGGAYPLSACCTRCFTCRRRFIDNPRMRPRTAPHSYLRSRIFVRVQMRRDEGAYRRVVRCAGDTIRAPRSRLASARPSVLSASKANDEGRRATCASPSIAYLFCSLSSLTSHLRSCLSVGFFAVRDVAPSTFLVVVVADAYSHVQLRNASRRTY